MSLVFQSPARLAELKIDPVIIRKLLKIYYYILQKRRVTIL